MPAIAWFTGEAVACGAQAPHGLTKPPYPWDLRLWTCADPASDDQGVQGEVQFARDEGAPVPPS